MKQVNHHIISSFSWNTSFSEKDHAFALQERLGAYSRFRLQQEVTAVFDKLCPPDQTWKIPLLELDLGVTDFYNLENELSVKLRKQLYEKLIDIIFYAANNSASDIEILTQETTQLEILAAFLQSGLMPWNHQDAFGSVNKMVHYQLKNNRQSFIEMIREVGRLHENVRKRIAWQLTDPNITKIIEGLEPNDHKRVIDFSNELCGLQAGRNLVPASATEFKKDIWFWALNYLLHERGTVFNKISFMKSSIRQMANHYNISYEELLDMIEAAVEEVNKKNIVRSDFIVTLTLLADQSKDNKIKKSQKEKEPLCYWERLEQLFYKKTLRQSAQNKTEFNELITGLQKENKAKFNALIKELKLDENNWVSLAEAMSHASLETFFYTLRPNSAARLTGCMYFLEQLAADIKPRVAIRILWKAGLRFIYNDRNPSGDNREFLKYCLAYTCEHERINFQKLCKRLVNVKTNNKTRTISSLGIYTDLLSTCFAGIANEPASYFPGRLHELILKLAAQLTTAPVANRSFVETKSALIKMICANPTAALKALLLYPGKADLKKILPYLLNSGMVRLLINSEESKKTAGLLLLADISLQVNKRYGLNISEEWINEKLMSPGVENMLLYPQLDPSKFLTVVLYNWMQAAPVQATDHLFIERLTEHEKFRQLEIPGAFIEKLKNRYKREEKAISFLQAKKIIKARPGKQYQVSKILNAIFDDKEFYTLRKNKNEETARLINYLLPGSVALMNKMVDEYASHLTRYLKNMPGAIARQQLTEIYWKCLLQFADHQGSIHIFKRSFRSAVLFNYPVPVESLPSRASVEIPGKKVNRFVEPENGIVISPAQVFTLIKKCISAGAEKIEHDSKPLHLAALINTGLQVSPAAFRRILSSAAVSPNAVSLLKNNVSFSNFSAWIIHDIHGALKDAVETLSDLYRFVNHFVQGAVAAKILDEYWKQNWILIKTNKVPPGFFEKIAAFTFEIIAKESNINAEFIRSQIGNSELLLNGRIKYIVAKYIPGIPALRTVVKPTGEKEPNNIPGKMVLASHKGLLDELAYAVIIQNKIPHWFDDDTESNAIFLVNELIVQYPVHFLLLLKNQPVPEKQVSWLSRNVNFKKLCTAIGRLHTSQQSLLGILVKFHEALGKISFTGISPAALQAILFKKVLKAWAGNNWRLISTGMIWNELVWDVCLKQGISERSFLTELEKAQPVFPPALQVGLTFITGKMKTEKGSSEKIVINKQKEKPLPVLKMPGKNKEGIVVKNAGMVMLNSYFPMLFDRLNLLNDDKIFKDKTLQLKAVHYLQYLLCGLSSTEESLLPLNKIMCGLALAEPVPEAILISEEHKNLIDGLLRAVIGYWPEIGKCTIDGFRGNWLIRDGLLVEQEDRWELTIEKRAYDILIHKSPFSFSIIKLKWMDKPIHVSWPY